MNLRFITRDGRMILQQLTQYGNVWENVVGQGVPDLSSGTPREYWLIGGRYFEHRKDAVMWINTEQAVRCYRFDEAEIVYTREVIAE